MHYLMKYIIILLLATSPVAGHAQLNEKDFRSVNINTGLSDNTVTSINQDDQGYIWIGTHDGLNRYDGSSFKKFIKTNNPSSLQNNKIFRIKNLGENRLGIITDEGFQILDTRTYQTQNYSIPDNTAFFIYLNRTWDILEIKGSGYFCATNTGFYWFTYNGKLVWRYDNFTAKDIGSTMRYGRELYLLPGNKILAYHNDVGADIFDIDNRHFLNKADVAAMLQYLPPSKFPKKGIPELKTEQWIYKTDKHSDSIYSYNFEKKKILQSYLPFTKIDYDWPGKLYAANDSTLIQTFGDGGFSILHTDKLSGKVHSDGTKYFTGYICNYIFVDKTNRYWIGTNKGLFVQQFLSKAISQFKVPIDEKQGNKIPIVQDILVNKKDIYITTESQHGIVQLDAVNMSFKKMIFLNQDASSSWNSIHSITQHTKDTLWLGSRLGLGWLDINSGKTGIYNNDLKKYHVEGISSCYTDTKGNSWLGIEARDSQHIIRYSSVTNNFEIICRNQFPYFFPLPEAHLFTEDIHGNVWMGERGITRFNHASQQFDTSITIFAGYRKFEDHIMGLAADSFDNLWIATEQNGLLKYNIKEKSFRHFTTKNGLSSDIILSLSQCFDNKIVVATGNKLNILNVVTNNITVYSQADGLPESTITSGFFYDSTQHKIWVGYHDVIACLPLNVSNNLLPVPQLTIETVALENDSTIYFPNKELIFNYSQNNMSIAISNLDFDAAENNILLYRLHADESWRNTENNQFIYLDNLAPGKYKLEIKLVSLSKRWADQSKLLTIIIRPPFWKTWWFILLSCLSLTVLIYIALRKRINNIRYKTDQDKLLRELEIKALHTQMNPHFIFNCLNSIKEMILVGEKEKASRYLSTFAQLLRDTLEQSTHSFTSLENTINHLERYISIEKIRFDNFTYDIQIDEKIEPEKIKIPPMLLQPLVENAIWHGLQSKKGEKKLIIRFNQQDQQLLCIIEDNGIGIKESLKLKDNKKDHYSLAIENINKRIILLNEKFSLEYKLKISDKSDLNKFTDNGTVSTLTIPLDVD